MPSLTQQRHRDNLMKCKQNLILFKEMNDSFKLESNQYNDYAILVEYLRLGINWIGEITGHVTNEQILDIIFKDFCIGK
jgi:tRNA modification GTPase